MRRVLLAVVLLLLSAWAPADTAQVRVTYYLPTGNATASGVYPYSGTAACSYNFPIGTVLAFDNGDQYTCLDRGALGSTGWVDLFAWSHSEGQGLVTLYGQYANVSVVR